MSRRGWSPLLTARRSTSSAPPPDGRCRSRKLRRPPSRADGGPSDLTDAVAALPAKQRQAVAYHYLAGLPYAEIATILDSSAVAARRAAADGIAALRRTYLHDKESEHEQQH